MNVKDIPQKEVFRYLGYHNTIPSETIQSVVIDCISELLNHCSIHHTYKIFDCTIQHTKIIIDNHVIIESKNLSKKYKVDQLFVEQIGKYVTDMKDRNGL